MSVYSQEEIAIGNTSPNSPLGKSVGIYFDSLLAYSNGKIPTDNSFVVSKSKVPTFLAKQNNVWIKFLLNNNGNSDNVFLSIPYPNIGKIELYQKDSSHPNGQLVYATGNEKVFKDRMVDDANFVFNLDIPIGKTASFYLHAQSDKPLQLPLFLKNPDTYRKSSTQDTLIIGLYAGIILAIFFYNIFLYFSTKDSSYLLYVVYLFCLLFAQLTFSGWLFKFIWPNNPSINQYIVLLSSALPGITGLLFSLKFLHVKSYSSILHKVYLVATGCYMFVLVFGAFLPSSTGYALLNYSGIAGGLLLIISSAYIAFAKKYRPAYYYFIAWFLFAIGRQVHSLKNLDIVPYNTFTNYILYLGSAIEAILLSLALADRINLLQREKDATQKEMLRVSEENTNLIKEQNVVLEGKVAERTLELTKSNEQLNKTLTDLKDAQTQLVDAEKMASLGQLTAGIAHEINNPINFVKSNIKPLQLDIQDLMQVIDAYDQLHKTPTEEIPTQLTKIDRLKKQIDVPFVKTEITSLMKGIEDGAERTAEIVRGLRTFSRLDESDIKTVDVHEGIESTLILLRNNVPQGVTIEKDFKAKGLIECFPGKLNQVFMNIISNGLQALPTDEHGQKRGSIFISTKDIGHQIQINIKDTGIGMSEEVKQKIFEPFFTTKDVGEGTGLGLSIVFKIIQKHQGKIEVISSPGEGAEFVITLFHTLPGDTIA